MNTTAAPNTPEEDHDVPETATMTSCSPLEPKNSRTHLLTLPYELRSAILHLILPPQRIYLCGLALFNLKTCNKKVLHSYLSLSQTCHQLRHEARCEFFAHSTFAVVALLPKGHLPRSQGCVCDRMIGLARELHFEMQNCGGRRVDVVLKRGRGGWGFRWEGKEPDGNGKVSEEVQRVLGELGEGGLGFDVLRRIAKAVEEAVEVEKMDSGEVNVKRALYVSSLGAAA